MSGIVLSSSVRQNLLSLQSTADLLATTQNRLATGKKVNTALDNPTNFFTAQSLDSRAGDINNLLDGIGNGVQVLQAANTGITSLQKLVDTAKSIANQALQTSVGYSTKSNVSATIAGATATDLRGTTSYTSATATSNVLYHRHGRRHHGGRFGTTLGGTSASLVGTAATAGDGTAAPPCLHPDPARAPARPACGQRPADRRRDPDRQRQDHHLQVGLGPGRTAASRRLRRPRQYRHRRQRQLYRLSRTTGTPAAPCSDLLTAIDLASGVQKAVINTTTGVATFSNSSGTNAAIAGGVVTLTTGTGADLSITGKADLLKALETDDVGRRRQRHRDRPDDHAAARSAR